MTKSAARRGEGVVLCDERIPDVELLSIARERSADLRAGKSDTVSWEEVKRLNGLSDSIR